MRAQASLDAKQQFTHVAEAINNLFEKWGMTQKQRMQILGFTSTSMLHRFEKEPEKISARPDLETRLGLLLNIHQALRLLFSNPENVYGYLSMPNHNPPFNGQKPIEIACRDFMGLVRVHDTLDGMRGGMW
jgi:hypothetical protein